jgi:hypothetical protein
MSVALLADIMTGAIPSTVPLGVFIMTFCQPLRRIYVSYLVDALLTLFAKTKVLKNKEKVSGR